MPAKPQELRSDQHLLDADFQGYKLSLAEVPHHSYELPVAIQKLQHSGDQFSYLYLSLISMQNHLIVDPWNDNSLYFINEDSVVTKVLIAKIDGQIYGVGDVLSIPTNADDVQEQRYNSNLVFASSTIAVIADGKHSLHIVNTGPRSTAETWTTEHTSSPLGSEYSFTLLEAHCVHKHDSTELHCLSTSIVDSKEKTLLVSRASTDLHWLIFEKTVEKESWSLKSVFKMNSKGSIKYAHFSLDCESLIIESTKPVSLPSDHELNGTVEKDKQKKEPQYFWQQSTDDIKIWFGLPRDCVKDDIKVEVTENMLKISLKNQLFMHGPLFHSLNADLTTWSITDNRAEIILWKREEGQMWSYLVQGDDAEGKEVMDMELVQQIHERLSHLCSENEAPADDTTPTFNPGQLEACDNAPEEDSRIIVINRASQTVTHEVVLGGHQKLFNVRINPDEPPLLCVRHDVDGTLWEVDTKREELCKHVGTLNAFGYVLASKQWKYSTCSPDLTYAVIVPTKQNLFIYKQNCKVDTQLKNRKTGHSYSQVGKQFLLTLDTIDEIVGVHASNDFLFTLTKNKIFVHHMKDVE